MSKKTKQSGLTPTPTNKKLVRAFTLAEMLVVVAIIAILAVGIFSVSNSVDKKTKIDQTKSTIELLCAAIEQYHHFYNEFPDPANSIAGYFSLECDLLDPNNAEKLSYRLSLCPEAKTILNQINPKMIKNTDKDDILEYIDAWGMDFRYEYDKDEKWNFPLITSAGPDKDFATKEDNITSRK